MLRLVPPVALPQSAVEILGCLLGGRDGSDFDVALRRAVGGRSSQIFGSGRWALAHILRGWAAPGRDEVVVPGYTCWTVASSVVRAGLRVRLVDVEPESLGIDPDSISRGPLDRVVAVVAPHLFARSCDVGAVVASVRGRDDRVRVLEDSAQAWPGTSGSAADALLLSFGRGKPLPLGHGGALLRFGTENAVGTGSVPGGIAAGVGLAATAVLGRPALFRLPDSLPFLGIGRTVYDPESVTDAPFRRWQARLGLHALGNIDHWIRNRTENASYLADRVEAIGGWRVPAPGRSSGPVRLPVLAPDREARDRVVARLRRLGVAATRMYPGTLAEIATLAPHLAGPEPDLPGCRELASRLLTLPTYPGLTEADRERVATAFESASFR